MTAKEMFERLGFKLLTKPNKEIPRKSWDYSSGGITYYNNYMIIKFDTNWKNYRTILFKNGDDDDRQHNISLELHQAINKQIEELGWVK